MSYRLKFDPDKCVGCYACHIACLDAHHDVEDVDAKSYRTVKKVVKNQFEKNICRAVLTAYLYQSLSGAGNLQRSEDWICTDRQRKNVLDVMPVKKVCPKDVIHFDKDGKNGKV